MPAPKHEDFYKNRYIMAPMVRAGRTPLRLLCLEYGADLVYTEELVDQKLLSCKRIENEVLGTIDYVNADEVVLRIAPKIEGGRIVLQIGTNSGHGAAAVARLVGTDVAAIDVNMGCPKPFSIAGGMGAALLTQPNKIKEILTALVEASQVPVTAKIRLREDPKDTFSLIELIESCGVSAIGVHGRRRDERNPDRCRAEEISDVVKIAKVPIIANGGSGNISTYEDIQQFRQLTGASSVMIARKALSTPSIFRREGVLSMETDIKRFLELACEFDENYTMTKYVVQRILGGQQEHDPRGRATVAAGCVSEICAAWGLEEVFDKWRLYRQRMRCKRKREQCPETGAQFIDVSFPVKRLKDRSAGTPKCVLNKICDEQNLERPSYKTVMREGDKRYVSTIDVMGKRFRSRLGQPNKKMAEQVAALSALIGLELRHMLIGNWEEE